MEYSGAELSRIHSVPLPDPVPDAAFQILNHNLDLLTVGTLYGYQEQSVLNARLLINMSMIADQIVRSSVRALWSFWQNNFSKEYQLKWNVLGPLSDEVLHTLIEINRIIADPDMNVERFLHAACEYGVAKYHEGDVRMTQSIFNLRHAIMTKLQITTLRPLVAMGPGSELFDAVQHEINEAQAQHEMLYGSDESMEAEFETEAEQQMSDDSIEAELAAELEQALLHDSDQFTEADVQTEADEEMHYESDTDTESEEE